MVTEHFQEDEYFLTKYNPEDITAWLRYSPFKAISSVVSGFRGQVP